MAARSATPEKRPGFFSQLKTLFTFTREEFPWVPWAVGGTVLLGIGLGILIGFLIPPVAIWSIILWIISGVLFGILGAMILLTRIATRAMYRKLDGRPGGVGHVLDTGLGRSWTTSNEPVQINPKTEEAVYRAVGKGGIVIVGEGNRKTLTRMIKDERMKASKVANGVPVSVFYVGKGEEDLTLAQLPKTIKALPKTINRVTRRAIIQRYSAISTSLAASLPIPKGIDPSRVRAPRPR